MSTRVCKKCGIQKDASLYAKDNHDLERICRWCKDCQHQRRLDTGKAKPAIPVGEGEKLCRGCKRALPVASFGNDKGRKDGLQTKCKECVNAWARKWMTDEPTRKRVNQRRLDAYYAPKGNRHHLKHLYGMTLAEYERLLAEQNGLCAICGKGPSGKKTRLAVDHCHATGKIRGLLCCLCNTAIGHFQENPETMALAIAYLARTIADTTTTQKVK